MGDNTKRCIMYSSLSSCHSDLVCHSVRTSVCNFRPQDMGHSPEHMDSVTMIKLPVYDDYSTNGIKQVIVCV